MRHSCSCELDSKVPPAPLSELASPMNRKQQMIKKTAKRAKAKQNKIVKDNPQKNPKVGYISKAVRAQMELEEQQKLAEAAQAEASPEQAQAEEK